MQIPNVCNHDSYTVVAAHSNGSRHGKGKAMKAHDWASVWACSACHMWLDIGVAPREEKEKAFELGMKRQKAAWAEIASDIRQPKKDRDAATWAMERMMK